METVCDALPGDMDALRAEVLALRAERAELQIENVRLGANVTHLEHLLAQLRRLKFGRGSEKLDPEQLQLALEDIEQAIAEAQAEGEKASPSLKAERTRERRENRPSLPSDLPVVEVVIEPQSIACPCCAGGMHKIGEETSRRLDIVPAVHRVLVTRRPKYACRACEGQIVQAPTPARLIQGGLPTEALVAQVLVNKYADHVPLYRQSQALARQGIVIDRSTLAFWVGYAAAELKPLWWLMRKMLLGSARLFADETTAPVLDPGRGRTKVSYLWAIARDDRPWGGQEPPAVVYTYAPGRGTEHALELLKDFSGVIQVDGYSAYKALAKARGNSILLSHCWTHFRRRFYDLVKAGSAPIATEALVRIAQLYAVEADVRGQAPEIRKAARQSRSKIMVDDLKVWLTDQLKSLPGSSKTAEAIRYGLRHWDGLCRFLDDGHLEMDTNTVERAMRPIALNRKNALFAGSDEGGHTWACIATFIECCKLSGVNPQAYLTDVLTKLVNQWPNSRLDELTPWAWKASNPTP
ncbi:IS66 family transposase [Caulobacter sp. FWC2]|uniref:IS66 family transposase n=1 Tax=Caulobacter sp. FWC2 TaxID=69664 RepID=UPI000C14E8F5|nr:IS66 family transposase [Caulobacter sp. FWC2]PIB92588.1 IS66 family transposase [Caulobacter sp. FWC2]